MAVLGSLGGNLALFLGVRSRRLRNGARPLNPDDSVKRFDVTVWLLDSSRRLSLSYRCR